MWKNILKGSQIGLGFVLIVSLLGGLYHYILAAPISEANNGDVLTMAKWNELVAAVNLNTEYTDSYISPWINIRSDVDENRKNICNTYQITHNLGTKDVSLDIIIDHKYVDNTHEYLKLDQSFYVEGTNSYGLTIADYQDNSLLLCVPRWNNGTHSHYIYMGNYLTQQNVGGPNYNRATVKVIVTPKR